MCDRELRLQDLWVGSRDTLIVLTQPKAHNFCEYEFCVHLTIYVVS